MASNMQLVQATTINCRRTHSTIIWLIVYGLLCYFAFSATMSEILAQVSVKAPAEEKQPKQLSVKE